MDSVLTCISCGSELPGDSTGGSGFCPHCGVSLVEATPVRTPLPPKPLTAAGGPPGPPPRRMPPAPPARAPMETNPSFSPAVADAPVENPFLAPGGALRHEENTPPIPSRVDRVVTSAQATFGEESPSAGAPVHPAPPRPPSPQMGNPPAEAVTQGRPPEVAPQEMASSPLQAPAVAPLMARAGATAPIISDPHAEFRKGAWRGPVFALVAVVALSALFFLIPSGESEDAPTAAELPAKKAVIGTSNSPEIIEEPERELTLKADSEPTPAASPSSKSDLSGFASDFKTKAGSK